MSIIIIIIIILFLFLFLIDRLYISHESFDDKITNLKKYENLSSYGYNIYKNIDILINKNPNILIDDNILIYFINWGYGFGSALTVFMSNQYKLNTINDKIICLPHFSVNTDYFKYHDIKYNNSFFLYFKYKNDININDKKIYFVKSYPTNLFVNEIIPPMNDIINTKFIQLFNNNFNLIINNTWRSYIMNIKKKTNNLIGIHLRSSIRNIIENSELSSNFNLINTLIKYKNKFDSEYDDYKIFIASDTQLYINISRIESEDDSVPLLNNHMGYKLGSDILNDCYCLSMCDTVYVAPSNIIFIISIINPNINMKNIEYIF